MTESSISHLLRLAAGAGEMESAITAAEEQLLDLIADAMEGLTLAEILERLRSKR